MNLFVRLFVILMSLSLQMAYGKSEKKFIAEGRYSYVGEHPAIERGGVQGFSKVKRAGFFDTWREGKRVFFAIPMKNGRAIQKHVARSSAPSLLGRNVSFGISKAVNSSAFGWEVVYVNCDVMANAALCEGQITFCAAAWWGFDLHTAAWLDMRRDLPVGNCMSFSGVPANPLGAQSDLEVACRFGWGGTNGIDPFFGENGTRIDIQSFLDEYAAMQEFVIAEGCSRP